ncbi:Gfo/Idh/MocA family protein [Streptomyces pristinaespiralis]|uniref:Oxidoreductase n=1 Tax=Streptomyces pristinaespiralis TaxID=38300 RepID=A0A0M5ISC0_STRPR|nr:Gfo/Idh/MocA family oxidoreductase [Streptomyces pristinaespiralis]ALC24886.1 oxidoreductase [Streptomyces pristinaespiralis]QMU12821.1 Gfo/Idh/MocA family oxidoreductase [Streptomyces pristinaespiralis]
MTRPRGRLRAAVVGTGAIAHGSHLPALADHCAEVELVAAVDVNTAQLDAFRAAAGNGVDGFTRLDEMLATARPDLVLLGSPPAFHREQTVEVLRAGAWVLCEKPLCLSLAEYDAIAAAEGPDGSPGPYASVVFQHRYGSGAAHARALLTTGQLGTPLVAHCQTTWYRDGAYYAVPWRGRWSTEGGGPAMGHGIHQMDLLLHLLGDWAEIRAMAGRLVHDVESEDVSTALVRFANGTMATVVNSVVSPHEVSRIRIDCSDATVELTHLYGHSNADWVYTPAPHAAADERRVETWRTPAADLPSSHSAQLESVLAAMRAGTRPPGSGPDARRTLEFVAALYKAAFTGMPVRAGEITSDDPYYTAMHGGHPAWAPADTAGGHR